MRQFRIAATIAAALLLATLSVTSVQAGEGAIVLTHGGIVARLDQVEGGFYKGPATLVWTPNGKVRGQANMRIIGGTPVSKTTRVTLGFDIEIGGYPVAEAVGEVVLTPSGNANVRFSN